MVIIRNEMGITLNRLNFEFETHFSCNDLLYDSTFCLFFENNQIKRVKAFPELQNKFVMLLNIATTDILLAKT